MLLHIVFMEKEKNKLQFNTYWNDKQKKAFSVLFDKIHTDVWYGWWAWGWKTYLWVSWQWMMRNKYPWTTGFFWRKELKRLKQTTLASYFKFCDDYNIPQKQRGNFNAQDSEIKFENGSKILLLDLANQPSDPLYTRFGSLELTDWFIDESNEIEEQCITIISTRIWRQKNEEFNILPKLLQTFNPDKWHVYRKYYKPFKEWTLESYRVFIPALATDNKKIPRAYIDQLMKADEVTKQRLLYGNFDYDDTPGRLFDYGKLLWMQSNEEIIGEKFITCDPAREWRDTTVIIVWNWLVIEKIIVEDKSNLRELKDSVRLLARRESVRNTRIIVDENGLWGWLVDELQCQWFINNKRAIDPKILNSPTSQLRKSNFWSLKDQCYYMLSQYVNEWKITYKWPSDIFGKLVEELDVVVQIDIDKDWPYRIIKKEDIKNKLGRSPDLSDAMMMRMFYEIRKPSDLSWLQSTEYQTNLHPYEYSKDEETIEFTIDDNPY